MVQERVSDSDSSMDSRMSECEESESRVNGISIGQFHPNLGRDQDELKDSDTLSNLQKLQNSGRNSAASSCLSSSSSSSSSSMIMSDCASFVNDNDHVATNSVSVNVHHSDNHSDNYSESELNSISKKDKNSRLRHKKSRKHQINPQSSVLHQPHGSHVQGSTNRNCDNKTESHHHRNHEIERNHIDNNYQIVPRTVPCVVLTPPALFSPNRIPLLTNVDSLGSRKSILLTPGNDSTFTFPNSTSAAVAAAAAFSSLHFNRLVSDNNCFDGVNLKIDEEHLKPFKRDPILFQESVDGKKVEEIPSRKLAFGIDRILSEERESKSILNVASNEGIKLTSLTHSANIQLTTNEGIGSTRNYQHQQPGPQSFGPTHPHSHEDHVRGGGYASQCSECFFLSRYCRRIQFPTNTPPSTSTSFTWLPSSSGHHSVDTNSSLLNSNGFAHPHVNMPSYGLNGSNFSTMSTMVSCNTSGNGRRKRSWSRAVFSNLQRKGLEKRFQLQKYITKPDRRQLAATLGLTDAQVKVWYQNRRMKWRHSKEGKQGTHIPDENVSDIKK